MPSLFDSETDVPEERKVLKHTLSAQKITFILTALCAVIYLLQNVGFEEPIMDLFHYPAYSWEDQEVWRYFTHTIVHLSIPHILFNLSWFWLFGGAIERRFGSFHFLLLVLVSAAVSGAVQNDFTGPAFFGLSGVVYAVLGYVLVVDKLHPHSFDLPEGFFTMLLVGLLFGFISPLFGIKIGNAAHISGFILGLVWGFLQSKINIKKFS